MKDLKFFTGLIFTLLILPLGVLCDPTHDSESGEVAPPAISRSLVSSLANIKKTMSAMDAGIFQRTQSRREEEITDDCLASFEALYANTELNSITTQYSSSYNDVAFDLNENNCVESEVDLTCSTNNAVVPGEADFQSACAAAGGELKILFFDSNCQMVNPSDGSVMLVTFDTPRSLDCIPSGLGSDTCVDDLIELVVIDYKDTLENSFLSMGYTSVDCEVGQFVSASSDAASVVVALGKWITVLALSFTVALG